MGREQPSADDTALAEHLLEQRYAGDDVKKACAALMELRRRHDNNLRAQARCQCGQDPDRQDEALQRLNVTLWEKRRQYDPSKRWLTWTKRILHNITVNLYRERLRNGGAPPLQPYDQGAPAPWIDQLPNPGPAPDHNLVLEELSQAMADCLQKLPDAEREALLLRFWDGMSFEEVGTHTGVPWQTAAGRAHRAKGKMKACLQRKGYEGGGL